MEKQPKCLLLLSLKEMAVRKMAVLLLSDSDIIESISNLRTPGYHDHRQWLQTIDSKIQNKMSKLELPESLTKQVMEIVEPVTLQIRRWKDCQEEYLLDKMEKIDLPSSTKLFWTSTGIIDYRKIAQELVRCDSLDVVLRYKLACVNCLEDDIPLLWAELPEEKKNFFYTKVISKHLNSPGLPYCWPHILIGDLSPLGHLLKRQDRDLTSFNQWAFERSVENGNKITTEYFFQKLTFEERETSLLRTVEAVLRNRFRVRSKYLSRYRREKLSDVSCYLLTLLTAEELMETVKAHPGHVLLRFLNLPWPDLFLENLDLIWTFVPLSGYGDFLLDMAASFQWSDYYFPNLFKEFFVRSSLDCKKCFVDQTSGVDSPASLFLGVFFKRKDSESVKIIFRNMEAADRRRLLFSHHVLFLFYFYMLGDMRMVGLCLQEAALSSEDMKNLKRAFIKENFIRGRVKRKNPRISRFFKFLDETHTTTDAVKKGQKRKRDI